MNNIYQKVWKAIISKQRITICTHINPDGDTVGSAYALKQLIKEFDSKIMVKISGENPPKYLDSVNDLENVSDNFFNNSQKIVVDTSSKSRIYDKRVNTKEAINIDHHEQVDKFSISLCLPNYPATGQVLYEMAKELNLKISKEVARGLFYAIWTDTEGMTQRNISSLTLKAIYELGKNGIKKECLQKLALPKSAIDKYKQIKSKLLSNNYITWVVSNDILPEEYYRQIIAKLSNESKTEIFVSILRNDKNQIRGSLRSKGNIDVSVFAKKFGGGGHYSSAGFQVHDLNKAQEYIDYLRNNIL